MRIPDSIKAAIGAVVIVWGAIFVLLWLISVIGSMIPRAGSEHYRCEPLTDHPQPAPTGGKTGG